MCLTQEQKSFFTNDYGDFWPFIDSIDVNRDQIFYAIEEECKLNDVFTIGPWFGKILNFLVRFGNVTSALEYGTANGYSAIWIGKALPENGHLVTIEKDKKLAEMVYENVKKSGLSDKITIINEDAKDAHKNLRQVFDFVFVDCAHFIALQNSRELLKRNGLFICDNVGITSKQEFNHQLINCSYLETVYLQCYLKGCIPENTAFSISIKL